VAPFKVHVLALDKAGTEADRLAHQIHDHLSQEGVEVLLDDRDERAGVKFIDADLLGIPYRIIVGKKAAEGIVELKTLGSNETKEVSATTIDSMLFK
jgi:prolyl-tRNA synthetase